MFPDFDIDFFSDTQYSKITIEISYKKQILCQINKDKGIGNIEIEFFYDLRMLEKQPELKFPLDDFINIISEAKKDLISN